MSDPDGQVFGDRSLLPAPGEEPAGDEVVALRTATTRTFETDVPGVFVTEQFTAPVNVEAGEGWVPIDPTLEAEGDSWANTADRVDVAVAGTADAEELAAVTLPAGASVGFALDGAVGVEADVDGDTAVFTDAIDGVDVTLQSVPGGVKETLVLASPGSPSEFTFDLSLEGLSAETAEDGSVRFVNAAGVAKVAIPAGFMVDAAGARSDGVGYSLSPDGTTLVVTADQAWLDEPSRVFPVEVDPSLAVVADADDTYVTQGVTADRSSDPSLHVGFDGSAAHRSFLHFTGPSTMAGMNVMAADLSLWQSGAGSCTATPVDVLAATAAWSGSSTTSWPGPAVSAEAMASFSSGKGYDTSCAAGAVGVDVTRQVDAWVQGTAPSLGIGLRARDETSAAQHKVFVSANGDEAHRPVLNVLWSDPTLSGAPADPTGLAPEGYVDTFTPSFEASYYDAEGDDGYVVFFGYYADTGAFAGALVSPMVESGETATAAGGYVPLDLALTWRAMAVDAAHEAVSFLSTHIRVSHPSVRIVMPTYGDTIEGFFSVIAEVDASITDATGLEFTVDGNPAGTSTESPFHLAGPSETLADGPHAIVATIDGGAHDGATSAEVAITVDNSDDDGSAPEASGPAPRAGDSKVPVVRRMLGVTDDLDTGSGVLPFEPINSERGDCGYSEDMPDGWVLWIVCDRHPPVGTPPERGLFAQDSQGFGFVPLGNPASPVFDNTRWLGEPVVPGCSANGSFRWATGLTSFPGTESDQTVVVVFFLQGCRDNILEPRGSTSHDSGTTGVATFIYDEDFPGELSVTDRLIGENLWDGTVNTLSPRLDVLHGDGAVYLPAEQVQVAEADGGYIDTYACLQGGPIEAATTRHAGSCTVARVAADPAVREALADRSNWQYFVGGSAPRWISCAGACNDAEIDDLRDEQARLRLPPLGDGWAGDTGTCGPTESPPCLAPWFVPPMHFQVVFSEDLGVYVSAAPQQPLSNVMRVRFSSDPVGPWSRPIDVELNCDVSQVLNCYQVGAAPELDSDRGLVFHYYDRLTDRDVMYPDPDPDHDPDRFPPPAEYDPAIRFVAVPLCAKSKLVTGQGVSIDYGSGTVSWT